MIAQDHSFEIGSTHHICEDYAISGSFIKGENTYYFGILCDGCSSSKNVDFGARLLALSAKKTLNNLTIEELDEYIKVDKSNILGARIVNNLSIIDNSLIKDNAFDATLLLYITDGVHLRTYVYGDGCVIVKAEELVEVTQYEYASNAPFYLAYQGEVYKSRLEGYTAQFAHLPFKTKITVTVNSATTTSEEESSALSYQSRAYVISGNDLFNISMYSDGIFSFINKQGNSLTEEMIKKYSNFPILNGEFVKRNFLFNKKMALKEAIVHQDDLSCVSFSSKV